MAARERKSPLVNLIAGGSAGFMEALICHPLDTIKVRMQLAKNIPRNAAVSLLNGWVQIRRLLWSGQSLGKFPRFTCARERERIRLVLLNEDGIRMSKE
jgi:hypothetical protein